MLCYWGAQVREGLGLLQPDNVKHADCGGIRFMCPKSEIQDMSAGKSFIGFIRDGKVSVLRLRAEDSGHDGRLKQLQLKKEKFRSIVCGGAGAVLLAYGGKVLIMDNSSMCTPLKGLDNRQVIQIACGDQHSMALTDDGQLFVWGENSHGQLGLKEGRSGSLTAQHIQSLSGIPLVQISAGGDHSFALSLSGVVFGWGKNNAGQLGLGDTTDRYVPTVVNSLNQRKTVFISCGGEHTATLSKGGTVFTFGSGCFGQLGHNSFTDEHHPRVVAELWGSKVSWITCGRNHTLVLVESSKLIYSFGCGTQGQLGNGQMINQSVPLPVNLPTKSNHKCAIEKPIAGEKHSFALCFKKLGNESAKPKPNLGRGVWTLNERRIKRWLTESDSKSWRTIKKEINKVFSSAACLNGSFLKTSCDKHYQTSVEFCGLDFNLVRKSFAEIPVNERVISEVLKVVQCTLLPSLNTSPAGVEDLRLYLLLPELIRVLQKPQRTELTEALASKILQLNPAALKVLEMYWSRLPDDCLQGMVKLFRKASAKLIGRIAVDNINYDMPTRVQKCVQVLQMLYKVCCSTHNDITKTDFIIHEINDLLDTLHATTEDVDNMNQQLVGMAYHGAFFGNIIRRNQMMALEQYYFTTLNSLLSLPCIFNLEAKCNLLKNRIWQGSYELILRRTALVDNCFSVLRNGNEQHLKTRWLRVVYTEDMYRSDVNKRDFFDKVFKELHAPASQMFMYDDNETMIWFPSRPSIEKERYFLFGILCGLAFNNSCVVDLPFPLALFKKLLNVKPSLKDLREFDPVLGKSLQYILDYSDDVEEMDMNFRIKWDGTEVELDPAEPGKIVSNYNRTDFVDKYVDYVLNKSVEEVFEEFRRGFFKGCESHLVEMFEPEELRGVMVGNEEYDWDTLKQKTRYEGLFDDEHPTIISFWEVFDELTSREKKAFLLFLTGFERVPILGMSQVKMRVRNLYNSTQDHLPQALTCHSLLELPVYQSRTTLKEKLIEALNHRRGFWED
ncbi:probable E3 ubiquitin-protein ligase HERC4 [Myxocyprinus asiaticus]|uniref:probable E3 ubiquitin-protein ligase HERC4 n=1 Tax=Myxocyprinus asiaticus TaxID=70543 RepID=UPI0022231682|nr:probable E3 ubiquitin-protein ligase HERC4 [Myxocyprinus asiaticus]